MYEMIRLCVVFAVVIGVSAGPATEASFRGQFCVDPRTMRKHAAYTEWADAYSCTRHRCQPGGRNLAIYTVGCKRVEAPESAIECEEVVEDTNMQFPYCCTRLRCLVVVRGEVWTRVLGQPWETLPAAPWSHMYKMKKPPPGSENSFLPKLGEGPVYELQRESLTDDENGNKVLRTKKSKGGEALAEDCGSNDVIARVPPQQPDIVIALSTNLDKESKKEDPPPSGSSVKSLTKHPRGRSATGESFFEEDVMPSRGEDELLKAEEPITQKPSEPNNVSEERYYQNNYGTTLKPYKAQHQQMSWTEIPQNQWNEHDPEMDTEPQTPKPQPEQNYLQQPEQSISVPDEKKTKSGNLQALVDAIGTRMRDIESAVQKMSEKVHKGPEDTGSGEKLAANQIQPEILEAKENMKRPAPEGDRYTRSNNPAYRTPNLLEPERLEAKENIKRPSPEGDSYRRGSKYLHTSDDATTEPPLFIEDSHLNGYFSDASNTLLRRSMSRSMPMEPPAATYMAPVQSLSNHRKAAPVAGSGEESELDKKPRKKRVHKKKRAKGHHKKHHLKDDKRTKFRLNSVELDKNAVSLEESGVNNN